MFRKLKLNRESLRVLDLSQGVNGGTFNTNHLATMICSADCHMVVTATCYVSACVGCQSGGAPICRNITKEF